MGTKVPIVPDDYGFGLDCPGCFAAGKTPTHVFAVCYDVKPCAGKPAVPNGRTFICEQLEIDPCIFMGELIYEGNTWRCYYDMHARYGEEYRAEISFSNRTPPQVAAFFGRTAVCGHDFDENLHPCADPELGGGYARVIVFVDPIIIVLTSEAHLVVLAGTLYERWDVGMDHSVYRLANKTDHTNVMVLIDREIIESE